MNIRKLGSLTAILLIAVEFLGCARWKAEEAPAGFAIVREHVISAPRNDPPISSTLDFTITAIDGTAVTRETVPPWVDIQRGALISAGHHRFTTAEIPHMRQPSDVSKSGSFVATVESGKVYFLVDKDTQPVLIEARPKKE